MQSKATYAEIKDYVLKEDVLKLECVICTDEEDTFEYEPIHNEKVLSFLKFGSP